MLLALVNEVILRVARCIYIYTASKKLRPPFSGASQGYSGDETAMFGFGKQKEGAEISQWEREAAATSVNVVGDGALKVGTILSYPSKVV